MSLIDDLPRCDRVRHPRKSPPMCENCQQRAAYWKLFPAVGELPSLTTNFDLCDECYQDYERLQESAHEHDDRPSQRRSQRH